MGFLWYAHGPWYSKTVVDRRMRYWCRGLGANSAMSVVAASLAVLTALYYGFFSVLYGAV